LLKRLCIADPQLSSQQLALQLGCTPSAANAQRTRLDVAEYEIGTTSVRVRPGQVVFQLDLIEVRPVSDKLVVVSASDISRRLETSGRVALYGILFDTNKSDIKPGSRAALDEIAKYLRANPNVKARSRGRYG
jgi:outer membrane protein OmpA-like peptidoglycan-associated protein